MNNHAKAINLISHLNAELGVGEIARRLISLLIASGVDLNLVPFEANRSRKSFNPLFQLGNFNAESSTISCVNPDQVGHLISLFKLFPNRETKHVGFWSWELEDCPSVYSAAAELLDEIWTISNHSTNAIKKLRANSVRTIQVPVPIPSQTTKIKREFFKIPENNFLVSTSFDYFSDVRRKNPHAAIAAFMKSFTENSQATLVIKSINESQYPQAAEELKDLAEGQSNIIFLDSYLNPYENSALLELSDVHLSLHRAEGYGINLADALARKTAVIATGYSGNLDFMDEKGSVLVPYELSAVRNYAGLKVESVWAEADIDFASAKLRDFYENPKQMKEIAEIGFERIKQNHGLLASVAKFRKELMNA